MEAEESKGGASGRPARVAVGMGSFLRRNWRWAAGFVALALVGVALLTAFHGRRLAAVVTPYPHDLAQVTFAVAGDVIPHEPVRAAAKAASASTVSSAVDWEDRTNDDTFRATVSMSDWS